MAGDEARQTGRGQGGNGREGLDGGAMSPCSGIYGSNDTPSGGHNGSPANLAHLMSRTSVRGGDVSGIME